MCADGLLGEEELAGEVSTVVYADPATGFGVVELAGEGAPRASGPLASLTAGQPVRLVGRWTEHHRYGPTFRAVYFEQARPQSAAGLTAFLSSDRFPGVGEKLAQRLVARFGLDLPTVAAQEAERLAEVRGVSPGLAATIGEAWRDAGALAALVQELGAVGLPASTAAAVHRSFGDEAAQALARDPYTLLEVRGVRWGHAEALARAQGLDRLDERRLGAGARSAHRQACLAGGHVVLDDATLRTEAGRLLEVDPPAVARALTIASDRGDIVAEQGPAGPWWYTPGDLAAERGLADELVRLDAARSRVAGPAGTWEPHERLTEEQVAAVRAALCAPVSVLTGGPGTGKTRTVVEVVRACEAADLRYALCAPTGRAAKRMEELTGRSATTIHRLLEARGAPGAGFVFGYDAGRRLPHDVVVADEWSMADLRLAWALVRAVGDGAHLLLVGDADQLPSVGPGAVLRDLLDERARHLVTATRLTRIHRQAAASRIVTLAHEVNAGEVPTPRGNMGDVFAVTERSDGVADRVAEIVAARAPAYFGCAPGDVQVLAPMYRGPAGVDRLNMRLKERLNPPAGRRPVAGWHEGDRVVQTRNDAELDVANGDVGEVVATDPRERTVEVVFPHGTVTYDGERAADLSPAWCLTVHKSQGGEWPVIVLVLDAGHRVMLWREVVYTAITRASRGLLLVGDPGLVVSAARRTGSGARHRRTRLAERLAAPGEGAGSA
ncbi:MAG TPA: AAA family ATPase [Egibacteraceae bacterium]|nr:AAA family ATPase [Egibacteraceae bacterium]